MNPYQVLQINPNATDDEVKKAYRKLAKKYHPDVSNEPNAEAKFKEVQAAYDEICDIRSGKTFNSYNNNSYRNNNNNYYYNNSSFYNSSFDASFNTAYEYIQNGRFKEANDILETISTRNAMWFYLSAIAQNGLGNQDLAKDYAKVACQMEPTNFTYRSLYNQLHQNDMSYRSGFTPVFSSSPLAKAIIRILILNLLMLLIFGRGLSFFPFLFFLF